MKLILFNIGKWLILTLLILTHISCNEFLDAKPQISVNIPETLSDLRLLLDDANTINQSAPGLIELGSDDYVVDYTVFTSRPMFEQQIYLWDNHPQFQLSDISLQWSKPYRTILISNVVLETLDRMNDVDNNLKNQLKGEALFVKSFNYYILSQIYSEPYVPNSKNDNLGVVYRPSSDFSEQSYRPTIANVYETILEELKQGYELLPVQQIHKTRPDKQAAAALLARVYLSMENYEMALQYAEKALEYDNYLIDFNTLPITTSNPLEVMGKEVIYHAICNTASYITASRSNVAPSVYNSFDDNDLRKYLYFNAKANGTFSFKASHSGSSVMIFTGLAIDELYFIQAECLARMNNLKEALIIMNKFLKLRWKSNTYLDFNSEDKLEVLKFILKERRKGLIFRGIRWSDLRRLNRDDNFKVTLTRQFLNNTLTSELKPNDLRYTYLIPEEVINMTGIQQNKR
ncbi:RagB/SusD family nutrient uptake outer membrane protein [Sphingobacterium bovistauri]|uniref:RagB/SusD family nutrient uptake outer membrane protein n=1 Tax=Sphingobacterium bovistauri TaxID=2781959 RepID=A0ABS7Z637_9SPHI|nr:RagB/SusD family nutrient uptake outer membrane protein [Sphingobacterium bovistauri]MCA5005655.1 RagB/SusD family nutrient uptake outer membrane protein [Sphingobacterium bovistauri]